VVSFETVSSLLFLWESGLWPGLCIYKLGYWISKSMWMIW
jgi:hypothetical protein